MSRCKRRFQIPNLFPDGTHFIPQVKGLLQKKKYKEETKPYLVMMLFVDITISISGVNEDINIWVNEDINIWVDEGIKEARVGSDVWESDFIKLSNAVMLAYKYTTYWQYMLSRSSTMTNFLCYELDRDVTTPLYHNDTTPSTMTSLPPSTMTSLPLLP